VKLFIEETTPALSIVHHGYRTYRPARYGVRGLLNRLMLRWSKWRDPRCFI